MGFLRKLIKKILIIWAITWYIDGAKLNFDTLIHEYVW